MIKSFRCRDTEALHARERVRRFANIESVARRKLRQLELAARLTICGSRQAIDLNRSRAIVPAEHSVRINDQWRVCFRWTEGGAEDVEITDYH